MTMKKHWTSPMTIATVASAILSVVAISVSVRSCASADRALALSEQDFLASRAAIYKATLNAANDELTLSAVDTAIQIQYGTINVPPQLDGTEWPIAPPRFGLPLLVMRNSIESFLDKRVKREKGFIKVIDQTSIPLAITSSYIARGQAYSDVAIYQLVYTAVVSDEPNKRPVVTFAGLVFTKRIPLKSDPRKYLFELWEGASR